MAPDEEAQKDGRHMPRKGVLRRVVLCATCDDIKNHVGKLKAVIVNECAGNQRKKKI